MLSIRFPANDIITTETGGTERLKVEQAGNVNIPQNLVAKIPEEVSYEQAAFTVIGSIGLQFSISI